MRWAVLVLAAGCSSVPAPRAMEWRAGIARAKITPAEPVMMAGYGSRNKVSEGVAADLWVRALALEDSSGQKAVLVTADMIGFGPVMSRRIKAEISRKHGLGEERVLLVGSHTHNGPVIAERTLVDHPEQAKEKDPYVDRLVQAVAGVVAESLGHLGPARLSFARGEARFAMNRRVRHPDGTWRFGANPEGVTDPDVPVLRVEGWDGQALAVLFTYACHCTSVRNGKEGFYRLHPDYAVCAAHLEAKGQASMVMYVTGCGGDIDPQPTGGIETAERHAVAMVAAVEAVLEKGAWKAVGGPLRFRHRRLSLPLEKPSLESFRKIGETGKGADQKFALEMLKKLEAGTAATSIDYPIVAWRFGSDLTLVALAGETCVDYALRIKRELPYRVVSGGEGGRGAEQIWVVGYANEIMCYIPSERILGEGGYEAGWHVATGRGFGAMQMAWSGWSTPFGAGIEDRIVGAVHEIMRE